jgi:hypothetical protein
MRVELRDGQWADLREHITHSVDKSIKVASVRSKADETLLFDWQTAIVRALVRDWNVRDPDGHEILITDADAMERAPSDIIESLFDPCSDAYIKATVPNAPTPPSSAGSSLDSQ